MDYRSAELSSPRGHATTYPARELIGLLVRLQRQQRVTEHRTRLGTAELRLLWLLGDRDGLTLRQISEQLKLEQSTVNRQVNGAVISGLLQRERSGGGPYVFRVTDLGKESFDSDMATQLGPFEEALDDLGADGRTLLGLLQRYLERLTVHVQEQHETPEDATDPRAS